MIVFSVLIILLLIMINLFLGLTKFFLKAALWMFVFIPLAMILGLFGTICCATFILMPLGMIIFGLVKRMFHFGIVI